MKVSKKTLSSGIKLAVFTGGDLSGRGDPRRAARTRDEREAAGAHEVVRGQPAPVALEPGVRQPVPGARGRESIAKGKGIGDDDPHRYEALVMCGGETSTKRSAPGEELGVYGAKKVVE